MKELKALAKELRKKFLMLRAEAMAAAGNLTAAGAIKCIIHGEEARARFAKYQGVFKEPHSGALRFFLRSGRKV